MNIHSNVRMINVVFLIGLTYGFIAITVQKYTFLFKREKYLPFFAFNYFVYIEINCAESITFAAKSLTKKMYDFAIL